MPQPQRYIEVEADDITWRFDPAFVSSNWRCTWGDGCQGILDRPAPELLQGCCSVGAELDGPEEGAFVSAMAAMLDEEIFQFHAEAEADGVFGDERRLSTRVIDGACIFLNRPGFAGGAGCALHLGAVASDESPIDWKPSVCWQLPLKVDWVTVEGGKAEIATLRGWTRADWNEDGDEMAWCCTEAPENYSGQEMVVDSLARELRGIVGDDVYVELRQKLPPSNRTTSSDL